MIEESKKNDNTGFGMKIVNYAAEIRENRERKKTSKNFLAEHAKSIKVWNFKKVDDAAQRRLLALCKKSMATQKKSNNLQKKREDAKQGLVKWDEYRARREALTILLVQAKNQLAMKKAWVLLSTFYSIINTVKTKFRANYYKHCMIATKDLASCRIKGIFKLTMKRYYGQYKHEEALEQSGVVYRDWNKTLMADRHVRKAKQALTFIGNFNKPPVYKHALENIFKPWIQKWWTWQKVLNEGRNFHKQMTKIQEKLREGVIANRAKLSVLQIMWDE